MIRRPLRLLTAILVMVSVAAAAIQVVAGSPTGLLRVFFAGVVATYLVMGVLIVERRPGNRVGPIVYALGLVVVFYLLADTIVVQPVPGLDAFGAWGVSQLDAVFFLLIALLFLSFPDGRLPSPAWRTVVAVDLVLLPLVFVGTAIRPGQFAYYPTYQNPLGVPDQPLTSIADIAYVGMIAIVGASALSLVGRWRRGALVERAQIKWVALAAVILASVMAAYALLFGPGGYNEVADAAVSIALGIFPVTIAIAILRYHLFEIDRIVSRTIAYLVITTLLLGTYGAVILVLQGPLESLTGGETIAVALSTLVAAAAFQPVRRWVQGAVDRRFDRARFDAEQTSAAFAERVRDEVDIDAVAADLRGTVARSLRPSGLGLWLRESAR